MMNLLLYGVSLASIAAIGEEIPWKEINLMHLAYFLNLAANISEKAEFLKYITPFGYTESADIVSSGCLDGKLIFIGMLYAAAAVAAGSWQYCSKDIH